MGDRVTLAAIAKKEAQKPYKGKSNDCAPNIQQIVARFPKWSVDEANGLWCAAFVYHCVVSAGFQIPFVRKNALVRLPDVRLGKSGRKRITESNITARATASFSLRQAILFFSTGYLTARNTTISVLCLKITMIVSLAQRETLKTFLAF